ncbi:hypothetical protein MMC25_000020 [Agyrium rufum]|nr:hypothetical protein [Agyrium rufum]
MALLPSLSFLCPVCPKTFAFESRLRSHMDAHNTVVICTFEGCSQEFRDSRGLKKHLESFHKTKKYKACDKCGRNFYRKDKYDIHAKNCSSAGKKRKRLVDD